MLKQFMIRAGFSFVMPDGAVLTGGDQIGLEDDVAQQHLHKLEEVPAKVPPKKPAATKTTTTETITTTEVGDLGAVLGTSTSTTGAADTGAGGTADPA